MSPQFVSTCPQCGRAVPKREPACRCGYVLPASDLAVDVPAPPPSSPVPPSPPPGLAAHWRAFLLGGIATAVIVAGTAVVVVLVLKGRTPAPAPGASGAAAPATIPPAPSGPVLLDKEPPQVPALTLGSAPAASIEDLVSRLLPAVVTVETPDGSGSGFYVSTDTLLTNRHVVGSHSTVTLRSSTGGRTVASVEATSDVDLAVLKVAVANPTQYFLRLAMPAEIKTGSEVIAIGSPLGLQNSVTRGIVSAMREVRGVTMIQTDTAINPGNSGGPLIDRQGRVIGVNTLKLAGYELQSMGFAVSIYHVRRMLEADFDRVAEGQYNRRDELANYERSLVALAARADEVDERWKSFRSSCFLEPETIAAVDREWFALADGAGPKLHDVARCGSWREYFLEAARRTRDDLRAIDTRAAMAGLPADQARRLRLKYKMSRPEWDR